MIVALPASDKAAGKRVRTDDSSSKKKSKKKKGSSTEAGGVLATEKDQVEEWLKHFANAEVDFTNFIAELKEELKAPTLDPTPLSPGGHRSVETLADGLLICSVCCTCACMALSNDF